MIELAIKVKGVARILTHKHTTYESIRLDEDDPILNGFVEKAIDEFKPEKDDDVDVTVTATLKWTA